MPRMDGITFLCRLMEHLPMPVNRRGWERLLQHEESRCARYGSPAAIVSIDLDGFKEINDTQGHSKGDEILVQASHAIRSAARNGDIVARLGGDEFAVLVVNVERPNIQAIAERFENVLAKANVNGSVGVAYRSPHQSLQDVYDSADQAMYERKRARKETEATGSSGTILTIPAPPLDVSLPALQSR